MILIRIKIEGYAFDVIIRWCLIMGLQANTTRLLFQWLYNKCCISMHNSV